MNSEKRKKDVLTAQKFDIFYIYFYISSKNFYFIGNLTANNYDEEFEKLQYKIHLPELKLKKKKNQFLKYYFNICAFKIFSASLRAEIFRISRTTTNSNNF